MFLVPVSLWNLRDSCAAVGLATGQGGPVCMHPSRSLGAVSGPHRIHGVLAGPVLSAVGPWISSAQAAVFPCTIAAPRHRALHRTLRYPTLTRPTVPCLPVPTPCLSSSVFTRPDLTYHSLSLSLCYCRMAILHYTVQPGLAVKSSAPCSWRRGLTSQL